MARCEGFPTLGQCPAFRGRRMSTNACSKAITALLLVYPYNDFLSDEGKLNRPARAVPSTLRMPVACYSARTGMHSSQVSTPVRWSSADTAENRSKHGRSSHCMPLDGSHSRVSHIHASPMVAGAPLNGATA